MRRIGDLKELVVFMIFDCLYDTLQLVTLSSKDESHPELCTLVD